MKKLVLFLLLACLAVGTVAAESPKYFSVSVGGMYSYEIGSGTSMVINGVGLQFQLNDMFSAGAALSKGMQLVNVSVSPINNLYASLYTGNHFVGGANNVAFGIGAGYDFIVNNTGLFAALGVYLDWLANNSASGTYGSISDGGVIAVGLRAKAGI